MIVAASKPTPGCECVSVTKERQSLQHTAAPQIARDVGSGQATMGSRSEYSVQ